MDKYLFVASMIILVGLGLVFYLTRDKKIPESASGESSDVLQKIIARLELRGFGQWPLPNRGIGFANQEFGIEFFPQRKTEYLKEYNHVMVLDVDKLSYDEMQRTRVNPILS